MEQTKCDVQTIRRITIINIQNKENDKKNSTKCYENDCGLHGNKYTSQ